MTEQEPKVELTQDEISNIARAAFLRGKVDGIRSLIEYFETFKSNIIKKDEMLSSLEIVLEKFMEALP